MVLNVIKPEDIEISFICHKMFIIAKRKDFSNINKGINVVRFFNLFFKEFPHILLIERDLFIYVSFRIREIFHESISPNLDDDLLFEK